MRAKSPYRLRLVHAVEGLVLLCAFWGANARAESTCKRGCPETDNEFLSYTPGNVYDYNFDSIMTVGITQGSENSDDTSLKVTGNAKLFAEGNCGYTLQLGAVKVIATKDSTEKKITQSIQKAVHFTMVGGKVEPELCVDVADNVHALNIKRAIISMLQCKPNNAAEVDIFGQCPTHTTVTKIGQSEVINKVRNLNTCSHSRIINSGILKNVIQAKPDLEGSTILKADYTKVSKIEKGLVNNVQLVEEYDVQLSGSEVGLRAKVVSNLKLKHRGGNPAAAPSILSGGAYSTHDLSIIFQKPDTYTSKNIVALKNSFTELVDKLDGYVKKDSAKGFVELIRLMRNSDTETLLELGSVALPNKVLARKVYLDALFRTSTSESARAVLKLFNKMNEKEKTIAVLSLHIVNNVDKEALSQAAALLNANSIKEVFLSVGTLVSKYCENNGCHNVDVVDLISKKFNESLKHCKANTKKDEERIIFVLKGIGNSRYLGSGVAPALIQCVTKGRSNRIRVAGLQAFSAAKCDANLQKKALELLADRNEDSELRIEAFLAVIECPSGELANEIAEIIKNETVLQVGGFITSTLRAIRDSTDQDKELQRRHFSNIRLTRKFPKDFRRYSYNNEVSHRIEGLGVGASADYRLIYSQNGFLPRSARLNIKAEKYGLTMNLLDASLRQENFENVLEYFLGPKGLVNKDLGEILAKVDDEGRRSRRSIADEASKVAKKYKVYGTKNVNDLNLDISLKFFGSEIYFLSLGDNIPSTFDEIAKEFTDVFENLKKDLTNYNKEFTSHNFFIDTTISYPTGLGIPLELVSNGFVTNKLDFGVSVDVDSLIQANFYNSKYKLKFAPSVDANVNFKFGFNALVLSSGVRSVFTLHSATGSSIDLTITNEGYGFDMNVELPRDKIELIGVNLQNDLYVAEQDKPVRSINLKNHKADGSVPAIESCYNQLESLGLTPCVVGNIFDSSLEDIPLQYFDFSVYVIAERNLKLKGLYNDKAEHVLKWSLDYSTPGSKESHDSSLSVEVSSQSRYYARASLDNSRYHFAVEAGLNNDDKELVSYAQFETGKDVKKHKVGFVKNGDEYRPLIEIQDESGGVKNEINGYRVDGRILVKKSADQKRLNFENIKLSDKDNKHAIVNGWADLGPSSVSTEIQLTSNEDTAFIQSNFKVSGSEFAAGIFVNDIKTPENIYGTSAYVHVTDELLNVKVLSKCGKYEASSVNDIQFLKKEGPNPITSSKFSSAIGVKYKENNIGSLKIRGLTEGQDKFEVNVDASGGRKVASVSVKYALNQKAQNDYELSANAKFNQHFVDIISKCDIVNNHFILDNVLTTSWGSALTLKGDIIQRPTPQDFLIDLQGSAHISGKDKPTNWIFKIIGAPEKTNAEFKVSRDNADIIKVLADTQHPQDKVTSGKVNVIVKNVLTAKGDLKLAKSGKGEITTIVESIKPDRKHKFELRSQFQVQHPRYNVEANVIVDGEEKLSFKTENIVDKLNFNTNNEVDIGQKKILLDANALIKGEWPLNGEVESAFTLTCPGGRALSGFLKRKLSTNVKTGIAEGQVDVELVDQNASNKQSLAFSNKVDKLNIISKEFATTSKLTYTNFEGQSLNVDWHIKKLPKGPNKIIDFGATANGPLVKSPIEVTFAVDDYSSRHALFNIGAKYGDAIIGNINGNYNLGEHSTTVKYEVHSKVEIPKSSFKTLEFTAKSKFIEPQAEGESYVFELFVDERAGSDHTHTHTQFVTLNTNVKSSQTTGAFSATLNTHKMNAPLEIDGSYLSEHQGSFNEENASGATKYEFNVKHGNKFLKSSNDFSFNGQETLLNRFSVSSSIEGVKDLKVEVKGKLNSDLYKLSIIAQNSEHYYALENILYIGAHKKGVEVHIPNKNGKPSVVVAIFEAIGIRKAKITTELSNVFDLDFKFNGEGSYNAIDDFYVVAQWNSEKLKLHNYDLDVRTHGKSVSLLLKNAQNEIVSGTATCALKKENNKSILEGQGEIKFEGSNTTKTIYTNFLFTKEIYELANDKEIGFSYNFNGNFGNKNAVSTFKITNKDFNAKLSICEEKKQCSNLQILASNDLSQNEKSIHSVLVLLDLREIGFPYEFELLLKNIREGFSFQYLLDLSINSNKDLKYKVLVNIQPNTNSKVQLKLPSREILLEANQKCPANGEIFGRYENSLTFFIDKVNKPQDVTRFVAQADITGIERIAVNAKGLFKLEHPTIRPLTVSGKLDANRKEHIVNSEVIFDIFRLPEEKIVATSHLKNKWSNNGFNVTTSLDVHSSGLNFESTFNGHAGLNAEKCEFSSGADLILGNSDLKASAFIFGNKERAELLVHCLNEEIISLVADCNKHKKTAKLNVKLQGLRKKPVEISAELQPAFAKINVARNGILNALGEVKLGKELKFKAEGAGKELINVHIGLDSANFLRTTYTANEENVQEFKKVLENELNKESDVKDELKKRFDELKQTLEDKLKTSLDSVPDFSHLQSNYQNNLKEIVKELQVDPAMKYISEALQNLCTKLAKLSNELSKLWSETYEKLHASLVSLYEKYVVVLKESLIPALEELLSNATRIVLELRLGIINLSSKIFESVLNVFKQNEQALRNYANSINEALTPFNEAVRELYGNLSSIFEDLVNEWINYWSNLPSYEAVLSEIKEKIEKLNLGVKLLELINNVYIYTFDQLQVFPLTTELSDFLKKVHEYIIAKLKHEEINDKRFVEELAELFVKALHSIWAILEVSAPTGANFSLSEIFSNISLPTDLLGQLSALLTFRSSVINFLINENLENFITKDDISSRALFDSFNLKGHIVDGRHVFTFDGNHYHFTGNCKYILAQDSVDNNFTVIAEINNGKTKSIFLVDREGQFIEINDGGALKLNGQPAEFPQHQNGIHSWRLYYTVYIFSEYGVQIICSNDLKVCHIEVNGFYTSKIRGLMGNGNAEPNDDLLQIDGSIANNAAAFVSGYGLGKCNPATVPKHQEDNSSTRTEICAKLFGYDSSHTLGIGNLFIDSKPYRNACDENVLAASENKVDKEEAACSIATAYASALKMDEVLVFLPKVCLKCPGPPGQRALGDEFTLKVPTNKADIVFVVDLDVTKTVMENLVAPVVTEVRDTLKSRGFTDIQIGVVVYSFNQRYPAILTSDNGKLNYKGNLASVKLTGPKPVFESSITQMITEKKVLDIFDILEDLIKSIVPQPDELAFRTALNYPFRAGAAKSIVAVRSNNLEYDNVLKFLRAQFLEVVTEFDAALLHVIAPVKDLFLEGVPSDKLIGFNSRLVATLDGKDAKKRPKLEFHNDMGIDFVLENGGWVFDTQNIEKLKPQEQKNAINQITTALADTLFKTEIVTDCRCTHVHGIHAQHKCVIKSSNFVPNKKLKLNASSN